MSIKCSDSDSNIYELHYSPGVSGVCRWVAEWVWSFIFNDYKNTFLLCPVSSASLVCFTFCVCPLCFSLFCRLWASVLHQHVLMSSCTTGTPGVFALLNLCEPLIHMTNQYLHTRPRSFSSDSFEIIMNHSIWQVPIKRSMDTKTASLNLLLIN